MLRLLTPILTITLFALLLIACGDDQAHGEGHRADEGTTKIGELRIGPDEAIMFGPDEVEWQPGPASLEEGAEYVVLEGDASKKELFTMRLRLPDGFRILPHTHPNFERVTVLSGVFNLGHGDTFDEEEARRLPAGSYSTMPPGMQHFGYAEGETVLQITSVGPWEIHYIDEADDPRLRD